MLPTAFHHIGLCVVFGISCTLAKPLTLFSPLEGSTDEEELTHLSSSVTTSLTSENQTTPVGPTHVETDFLSQVVKFLEENMLLILVAATLILLVVFIISGAVFMSRRRKVNAYYPSSFPSKMYVDDRDKTGGAKLFNEVPEKTAPEQESEPMDSHRQLQEDIMRAAKSLRTPNKSVDAAEGSDHSQKAADHSLEDDSKPEGSILDQQLPSLPEEKEQLPTLTASCDLSDCEAAAVGGSPQMGPPDQPHPEDDSEQFRPEKDDSLEPLIGRSPRPSSLHIHNDSATLQLIAGEKTAF